MSATHGLTAWEISQSVTQSLAAAARNDVEGVDRAMAPLFRDDACDWDWFTWTIGMVAVSTNGAPRTPGLEAVPEIVMINEDTGERKIIPVDEAPPEFPKAVIVVLRLSAYYLNGQRREAWELWRQLLQDETARAMARKDLGEIEGDDEPSLIGSVLRTALEAATTAVKARVASLQ